MVLKFINPMTYIRSAAEIYIKAMKRTHVDMRAGSIKPLFKFMFISGCCFYFMEYKLVGKFHVQEKQEIIAKALKDHHH